MTSAPQHSGREGTPPLLGSACTRPARSGAPARWCLQRRRRGGTPGRPWEGHGFRRGCVFPFCFRRGHSPSVRVCRGTLRRWASLASAEPGRHGASTLSRRACTLHTRAVCTGHARLCARPALYRGLYRRKSRPRPGRGRGDRVLTSLLTEEHPGWAGAVRHRLRRGQSLTWH